MWTSLTDRDRRLVRWTAIGLGIYLVLFFGFKGWRRAEAARLEYGRLVTQAETIATRVRPYENRALLIEKLRGQLNCHRSDQTDEQLIANANAAVQTAARESGVKILSIRESGGRVSARELASMRISGAGNVQGLLTLLSRFDSMNLPLIVDSIQVESDAKKPGALKLTFHVVIVDATAWDGGKEGTRNG